MDGYAVDAFAVQGTEVRAVACDQSFTAQADGGGKNGSVFLREQHG